MWKYRCCLNNYIVLCRERWQDKACMYSSQLKFFSIFGWLKLRRTHRYGKVTAAGTQYIDCGVWLTQVQSPEPSTSHIPLSTYLTALTNRATLLSARENYVETEMSAEYLLLTCKRHSINSHFGNHLSFFKNGLLSFASKKSCWDLQHRPHIQFPRTDPQTLNLTRLLISKSAPTSYSYE